MPYIIATEQNGKKVYLQDKVKRVNGYTVREWSPNKKTALVLFVNDQQLARYIDDNLGDLRDYIESIHIRTSPKPSGFKPITT